MATSIKTAATLLAFLLCATTVMPARAQLGKLKGLMGKKEAPAPADTVKTAPADKPKSGGFGGLGNMGSKLMSKAVMGLAKVSGGAMASASGSQAKVADLTGVVPTVIYVDNTTPADLGTIDMEFFKDKWVSNGTNLLVMLTKPAPAQSSGVAKAFGSTFIKVDGDITAAGKPMPFAQLGIYNSFGTDKKAAQKVEITTSTGQKSSFTVPPAAYDIKVLSVNGQKGNPTVDLSKDVVLEVAMPASLEGRLGFVQVMGTIIGLSSFYDAGSYPLAKRMVIPAVAFRNLNTQQNMNYARSFLLLSVREIQQATGVSGPLAKVQFCNIIQDGQHISAPGGVKLNKELTAEGSEKLPAGPVSYKLTKGNANYSRPISELKKVGVISFNIAGTTYSYTDKTNRLQQTRTQTTVRFPEIQPAAYQAILAQLYDEVMQALKAELGADAVPVEQVKAAPAYAELAVLAQDDQSSETSFLHAYKETKHLPSNLPIAMQAGPNNMVSRLLHQAGVDGLLRLTLNMQIASDRTEMIPTLQFELSGEQDPSGGGVGLSTYFYRGEVKGEGIDYSKLLKDKNVSMEDLAKITRHADLVQTFRRGLREMVAKEKANPDYEAYWLPRRGRK